MKTLTKIFDFCASHKLWRPEWDLAKNLEVFGKCANPNGHGHNYQLEVSISGEPNPITSMIIDAAKLKRMVDESIIQHLDHKNLNEDVPWLKESIPTVEAIVDAMWNRLDRLVELNSDGAHSIHLQKIQLWETPRIYAVRTRDSLR